MKKVAVLIPCYNEEKTIGKVVEDYKRMLPDADIYVYDNNSSDKTAEIARESGAIVRYEYRQGKGNVIRSMFRDIEADCYLMIDGDDTYPAENAQELIDAVLNDGADMAIGDRLSSTYFTENKRPFHNFGNVLVRRLINFIFKSNIQDIMTGYRAFSYQFVKSFPVLSKGFEIETEMSIFAIDRNFYIKELPVNYRDRPEGSESKLNTFSDGYKVLKTISDLFRYYKPALFFSIVSLICLLLSAITFFPIFFEYTKTGLVEKLPTLVISGVFMISTIVTFAVGVILENISKSSRQQFELTLNQLKFNRNK